MKTVSMRSIPLSSSMARMLLTCRMSPQSMSRVSPPQRSRAQSQSWMSGMSMISQSAPGSGCTSVQCVGWLTRSMTAGGTAGAGDSVGEGVGVQGRAVGFGVGEGFGVGLSVGRGGVSEGAV